DRAEDGVPAAQMILTVDTGLRLARGRAEPLVRGDDERRQERIAVREVPVDRRRRHAELAGHRAHRQPGGAPLAQMPPGDLDDLGDEFGTDAFADPRHAAECATGADHRYAT